MSDDQIGRAIVAFFFVIVALPFGIIVWAVVIRMLRDDWRAYKRRRKP